MPAKKGQSTNFVVVDGIRFYKTASGYYSSAKAKRLHVYIWEREHGPVPSGHDIHHKDGNKDNNSIENLVCVPRHAHHADHMSARSDQCRDIMFEHVLPAAKKWHKSDEGRDWHKEHYKKSLAPKWDNAVTLVCEYCGKEYETKKLTSYKSRFCSNNCRTQWRRVSGVDNEERTCVVCGAVFTTNKYSKAKTCSKACSAKAQSITKTAKRHPSP